MEGLCIGGPMDGKQLLHGVPVFYADVRKFKLPPSVEECVNVKESPTVMMCSYGYREVPCDYTKIGFWLTGECYEWSVPRLLAHIMANYRPVVAE